MYTSDIITKAIDAGFRPGLISGKKLVRLYICHLCKEKSMAKFYDGTRRFNACRCGYRKEF